MIGLDIGTKYLKICQVEKKNNKYTLSAFGVCETPVSLDKTDGSEIVGISQAIRRLLHDHNFSTKDNLSSASIGGKQIIIRKFVMSDLPQDEIRDAIKLEAEQVLFSSLDSMSFDYQILSVMEGKKNEVLLVAAPNPLVEKYLQIAKNSNIDLIVVDVDNLALANCFFALEPKAQDQAVMLLNLGHTQTVVTVLGQGKLIYSKNINFGGKDITTEIEKTVGITHNQAEELKKNRTYLDKIGINYKSILRKSTPDLLEGIYRSLEYYNSQKMVRGIERILLTGGTAYFERLDTFIADFFNIRTEKWNPLLRAAGNVNKDAGMLLSISFGAALREK